ncbi:MAG TPA: hypothetical protein P5081_13290 [Phycisphaerae bacterium]|nr:hypothetical protein [Phycisphaerae bacterium]HRW53850.1 hypothetical protein [Phycisphaerae bacterium]
MTLFATPLALLLVFAQTPRPAEPSPDDERYVVVEGTRYELYPPGVLERRGIDEPAIPREENAAYVYFDAINLTPPIDDDVNEALVAAAGGDWPEGAAADALTAYIAQSQAALDLARKAAGMEHYAAPLFRGETDMLTSAMLPSLNGHRRIARLLVADAMRRAKAGDFQGAIDNLLSAQQMGRQMSRGVTTIEGLVGMHVGSLATKRLATLAEAYDIDPALLRRTVRILDERSASIPDFETFLHKEEIFSRNILDDFFDTPGDVLALTDLSPIDFSSHERPIDNGWRRLRIALRRVYLPDRAMRRHLDDFYGAVRRSVTPLDDGTPGTVIDFESVIRQVPAWDVINASVLPGFDRIYELTLRLHSEDQRSKLRVAIAAYRAENHRPPATLDALTPRYLERISADPMTGSDFDYNGRTAESGAPLGLEDISSPMMETLRQQRLAPATRKQRSSKWRRYVARFNDRYQLTDSQRNSAESILRDIERQAGEFESRHAEQIRRLIENGEDDAARRAAAPLESLFEDLRHRLQRLPTARQRAAGSTLANTDTARKN